MQFIVTGYDGTDDKALERRLAARDKHIQTFKNNLTNKTFLYGAAIINSEGNMSGSVIICEFPSKETLKKEWLDKEPYVLENVWLKIDIKEAKVPPFLI